MSLKPGDMNCRIAISYVQSGRGPLGEPLPEKQVESRKSVGKTGAGIGAKKSARWISNRWWKPVCSRSYPACWLILTGKSRRKSGFIPSGISTAKQTGSLSRGG